LGPTTLSVTGETSGRTASTVIDVSNPWPQLGNGPTHVGFEPNDSSFYNLAHPGAEIFLDPAWQYQSGARIDSSPVVAQGVADAGTEAGTVIALNVRNGVPRWTWTEPGTVGKITSTPALDTKKKLLFVAANNGMLCALSTTTGSLVWSRHVGGLVSSTVLAHGWIYFTSQSGGSGHLEAITENDVPRWSEALASATHAARPSTRSITSCSSFSRTARWLPLAPRRELASGRLRPKEQSRPRHQ
jgi:outer membrane protein assembly factor BamB